MAVDRLNETFAALADPTRRAILARLASGEATVLELAEPFEVSLPAISRHLKVLEKAGLISRGREAQWRPCKIEPEGIERVDRWVDQYRALWDDRFGRMDEYLSTLTKGKPDGPRQ
jgi:DNA-binding transcriptional ArsR family regulator